MPGDRFEFDENGDTFLCFLAAFYTLFLLPLTYFFWSCADCKDPVCDQGKRKCMCQPCQLKRLHLKSLTPMKRLKKIVVKGGFLLAWVILFLIFYKLTLIEPTEVGFDPFLQLEIDRDASLPEIRRAYKLLSLKYHPDKGGDQKRFILISKAYAALTDEESRKNWEQYGNPDGPTAAHFGIALPKWMIQRENFYLVIGAYVFLFMLLLPIAVGRWWYNTMKFSSNHVLLDTIRFYYYTFMRSPYMAMPRVIKVLSNTCEFNPHFNKEVVCRPSDNVDLPPLIRQIPIFTIFRKAIVGSPSSVKARALIHAHLERLDLPSATLHTDRQYIVKNAPRLIDEMINTLLYLLSMAMEESGSRHKTAQHLATIENCMHLVPMLVQALTDNASPLLQLPHIGQSQLRHMATKQRNVKSIRQLAALPDDKRRSLLRSLSEEQYRDVLNVCTSMPALEVSYRCEVLDDEDPDIWPFSIITTTVTLKRQPVFTVANICNVSTNSDNSEHYPYNAATGNKSGSAGWGENAALNGWSNYNHQAPNARLYTVASPSLDADPRTYGDFVDEDDGDVYGSNQTQKPNKPITHVWDKNKRKKPARKNKRKQQKQPQRQKATTNGETKVDQQQPSKPVDEEELDEAESDPDDEGTKNEQKIQSTDGSVPAASPTSIDSSKEADPSDESRLKKLTASRLKPSELKARCTHVVHCPHFPVEKFEGWWIYLVDRKLHQLITKPMYVPTLQTEEEICLRFAAPSVPGTYLYTLCVRSDSYIDGDVYETVRFTVKPLPDHIANYMKQEYDRSVDDYDDDDDYDDEEEDDDDDDESAPEDADTEIDEDVSGEEVADFDTAAPHQSASDEDGFSSNEQERRCGADSYKDDEVDETE